jgi:hypothetical protein
MKPLVGFSINLPERLAAYFSWLAPLAARITVGWVFPLERLGKTQRPADGH